MTYADQTINDPNPLKRWIHHQRLNDAIEILRRADPKGALEVLDFGGGDGELLHECLKAYPLLSACLYEPTPALRGEAEAKLAGSRRVQITRDLRELKGQSFDLIFCLEVFEHLPPKETDEALAAIYELIKPSGQVVIGVPHEIFLPALAKGLFRMVRRFGAFDAHPVNIARATIGLPPRIRPTKQIAPGFSYYRHHMGFDHRRLEQSLKRRFEIVTRWFSPAKVLGPFLNSEVYYLLKRGN